MGVTRKAVEEPLEILVQHRVALNQSGELIEFNRCRQFSVDEQVAHLDEGRLLRQLLDRVAAVTQDAGVAVNVGDGALGRRGVHEPLVVCGVAGLGQQRTQRDPVRTLGGVDDLQVQFPTGISERGGVVGCGHINPFLHIRRRQSIRPRMNLVAILPTHPIGANPGGSRASTAARKPGRSTRSGR